MIIFKKYIFVFLFLISPIIGACQYKYLNYIKYLDSNYTNNTPEKKQRFEELKNEFLQIWLDTSNCFVKKNPYNRKDPLPLEWKYPKVIRVSNILHSQNYDTVLILLTWYAAELRNDEVWQHKTTSRGITAIIDSNGRWNFYCHNSTYTISDEGNKVDELEMHLKRLIIKGGYLKKDKTPDPTFFFRLFTDSNMFFTEMVDNQKKGRILAKSKEEYFKIIKKK